MGRSGDATMSNAIPGRDPTNVGELAERLQAHAHGVVSLVTRCESRGLVQRRPRGRDGREVEVHLLATPIRPVSQGRGPLGPNFSRLIEMRNNLLYIQNG